MTTRPGRRYLLLEAANVSDTVLAELYATVSCPACGAEPGELCRSGPDHESQACVARWMEARVGVPGKGRCKECRFVEVVPGKVSDGTRDSRHYVEKSPEYLCRRYPPRRSLGHEYHLTEVDPLGWCGEFRSAGWVRDGHE